jgi:hypothetical protein
MIANYVLVLNALEQNWFVNLFKNFDDNKVLKIQFDMLI